MIHQVWSSTQGPAFKPTPPVTMIKIKMENSVLGIYLTFSKLVIRIAYHLYCHEKNIMQIQFLTIYA